MVFLLGDNSERMNARGMVSRDKKGIQTRVLLIDFIRIRQLREAVGRIIEAADNEGGSRKEWSVVE